ncbi:MAG TPA: hypothetical protein VGQ31_06340 [Candidatus Limnocylindrales bacterium]|nr:hypothetical protein [Candidatus Limnocylindrales bacterium]
MSAREPARHDSHPLRTPSPHTVRRWRGGAGIVLVVALAACTGNGGATGGSTGASPTGVVATPAAGDSAAATTGGFASPSPSGTGVANDAAGDVTPGFVDIVRLGADGRAGSLELTMDLAADVPAGTPLVGSLAYTFDLDTDGDGSADVTAALTLAPGGGYTPSLVDARTGAPVVAGAFPGTANLAGRTITMSVRFEALGCPASVGVRASSKQTRAGTTVTDQAPDAAGSWIVVTAACPPSAS